VRLDDPLMMHQAINHETTGTRGVGPDVSLRSIRARIVRSLTTVACAAAIICFAAYRVDSYILRTVAKTLTASLASPDEKALALNHWIHAHLPTARNRGYFGWSRLRATPVQVLDGGGDCADKSRLLSTMLRNIGIPATMAMLFDPKTGDSTHTVVEARIGKPEFMVLDPSFDLSFPNETHDGYLGLLDLRRDPGALHRRLAELQLTHAWPALCYFYPESYAPYDRASTVNWNKNALTRWLGGALFAWAGDDMYHWSRPVASEEPKLLVGLISLAIAGAVLIAGRFARTAASRRRRRARLYRVQTSAVSQITSAAAKTGPSVQHNR